jgi:hypothetical protein
MGGHEDVHAVGMVFSVHSVFDDVDFTFYDYFIPELKIGRSGGGSAWG